MAKETKPKRGRPALPKGEAKGKYVPIRFSDEDVKLFSKAMKKSGHKTLSGWIRHTLREAVHEQFTENLMKQVIENSAKARTPPPPPPRKKT